MTFFAIVGAACSAIICLAIFMAALTSALDAWQCKRDAWRADALKAKLHTLARFCCAEYPIVEDIERAVCDEDNTESAYEFRDRMRRKYPTGGAA